MGAMRARRWLWCGNLVLVLGFLSFAAWAARYEPPPVDPLPQSTGTEVPATAPLHHYHPILAIIWRPPMHIDYAPRTPPRPDLDALRDHLSVSRFVAQTMVVCRKKGEEFDWQVGESVTVEGRTVRLVRVEAVLGRERAVFEMGGRRFIATPEGWQAHR